MFKISLKRKLDKIEKISYHGFWRMMDKSREFGVREKH